MRPQLAFGISILLGFLVWGLVVARYIWPALHAERGAERFRPILLRHAFRFVGLCFLVPGVVGLALVWTFNLWGTGDLLYAYDQGVIGAPILAGQLGAAYFIPTVVVALLLVTHGLVFRMLLQPKAGPRAA